MKTFIQKQITKKAQKLIEKHQPKIVAITGSVGKTSTTKAISCVLGGKYRVRTPMENYNNEFGVPLTILGMKSPGKSVMGWLKVLMHNPKEFPEVLVLEYGADRPGDIAALCEIAKPDVAVLTAITPVHAEFFGSVEALAEEKAALLKCLPENGLAVVNADDERVRAKAGEIDAEKVFYGFSGTDVQAGDYSLRTREDFSFDVGELFAETIFNVKTAEGESQVVLKNMLGKQQVSAALAAIAVGQHFGLGLEEIVRELAKYESPPGRLKPLPGIKGSLILDDSYNAAPASMLAALEVLREFYPVEERRRIAVLGEMGELGKYSESEHRGVGMRAAEIDADLLLCVGEKANDIGRAAIEAGLDENRVQYFTNSKEAGDWLDMKVKKGDIILVKGSQSSRMEILVKDIMAEPLRAGELLVRQYGKWLEDYE